MKGEFSIKNIYNQTVASKNILRKLFLTTSLISLLQVITFGQCTQSISAYNHGDLTCYRSATFTNVTINGNGGAYDSIRWNGPSNFTTTNKYFDATIAGEYTVKVYSSPSCVYIDTMEVIDNTTPPTLTLITDGSISCTNSSVQITASAPVSIDSWTWFGPGGWSSEQNPTFSQAGWYYVSATPSTGCVAQDSIQILDNSGVTPVASGMALGAIHCNGGTTELVAQCNIANSTFSWTGPNGFTGNGDTITVSEVGNYIVTATTPDGCTDDQYVNAPSMSTPVLTMYNLGPLSCYKDSVMLDAKTYGQSHLTFQWTGPNAYTSTKQYPLTGEPGKYYVTATDTNGCTDFDSLIITETLDIELNADQYGALDCNNSTVKLRASVHSGLETMHWYGPNNFETWDGEGIEVSTPGEYKVTKDGCLDTVTLNVGVDTISPSVNITTDNIDCQANTIDLVGSGCDVPNGVTYEFFDLPSGIWDMPDYSNWPSDLSDTIENFTLTQSGGPDGYRFTSYLKIDSAATYTFYLSADNIGELYIDDGFELQVKWYDGELSTSKYLTVGMHKIVIDFIVFDEWQRLNFKFSGGAYNKQSIPNELLFVSTCDYEWTGPNSFSSTAETITVSDYGTYTLNVTGSNGCSNTTDLTVDASTFSACSSCDGQILDNGNFESNLDYWRDINSVSTSTADANNGSKAVQITGMGGIYQSHKTLPGTVYDLSYSAKNTSGVTSEVSIYFYDADDNFILRNTKEINSTSYEQYELVGIAPPNADSVTILIYQNSEVGTTTVDALCLDTITLPEISCSGDYCDVAPLETYSYGWTFDITGTDTAWLNYDVGGVLLCKNGDSTLTLKGYLFNASNNSGRAANNYGVSCGGSDDMWKFEITLSDRLYGDEHTGDVAQPGVCGSSSPSNWDFWDMEGTVTGLGCNTGTVVTGLTPRFDYKVQVGRTGHSSNCELDMSTWFSGSNGGNTVYGDFYFVLDSACYANLAPPTCSSVTLDASVSSVLTNITTDVNLVATSNDNTMTFEWTGPLGFNSTDQFPIVSDSGLYIVTGTTSNCTKTDSIRVKQVLSEICNNGIDDDGDGLTDCEDDDCFYVPGCGDPHGHSTPEAQPQANQFWAYGDGASLNFKSGTAEPGDSTRMATAQGSSSVSGSDGSRLFYSDGRNIWNGQNEIMENGSNLLGGAATLNATMSFQDPALDQRFFLVVADNDSNSTDSASYSIIDLAANDGHGRVSVKNKSIPGNSFGLTAIPHKNGRDIWVITADKNSTTIYVTGFDQNGGKTTNSYSFTHPSGQNLPEYINISANATGDKLAIARNGDHHLNLYDFNNQTGAISNLKEMDLGEKVFGIEFSPNGLFLYASSYDDKSVFQLRLQKLVLAWDGLSIEDLTAQEIVNTRHDFVYDGTTSWGQMAIAPDGRIYTGGSLGELGTILRPNWPTFLAGWSPDALSTSSQRSGTNSSSRLSGTEGMPNFMNGGCLRTGFLLPVELIRFDANSIDNSTIQLEWVTEAEVNNEKFLVQRSSNGVDFETIGEVEGNGTSNQINNYTFIDNNFERNNIVYYRLKQIDFDGAFEYTNIKAVVLENKVDVVPEILIDIFPNPVVDFIQVKSNSTSSATVALFDNQGRGITYQEYNSNDINIDARSLAPGNYFIYVEQGDQKITQQFIKK